MQALSRREENEVMDIAKAEAMASCHEHVKGQHLPPYPSSDLRIDSPY